MEAYFPIQFEFDGCDSDGIGGKAPDDPGTVYVVDGDEDTLLLQTTLSSMVDYAIEGVVSPDGKIADIHIRTMTRLRDSMLEAAAMIDAAMP